MIDLVDGYLRYDHPIESQRALHRSFHHDDFGATGNIDEIGRLSEHRMEVVPAAALLV